MDKPINKKTLKTLTKSYDLVKEGDEKAFILGLMDECLTLVYKKKHIPIDSMIMAADNGNGLEVIGSAIPNSNAKYRDMFQIVVKDDNKLIVCFKDEGISSFGFEGAESYLDKFFLFIRNKHMIIIISASKDENNVNIFKHPIGQLDSLTPAIFEFILKDSSISVERSDLHGLYK